MCYAVFINHGLYLLMLRLLCFQKYVMIANYIILATKLTLYRDLHVLKWRAANVGGTKRAKISYIKLQNKEMVQPFEIPM